ncbi:TPA: polymorphic toxin MafB class 1, partial [Neisseria gonorrhoeae]
TAQYGNPYQETVYIKVSDGIGNSQTLISNRIHPFYSDGKWIKAEDLKAGSRLLSESGKTQTVRNTVVKPKPLKAYNLTVADWHTYFVKGDKAETEGVWVHNDCPPKPKPTNHAQQRKEEAKNDSHRSVGDSNRVVREGKQYLDSDTGNHVYVKGDKVVILTPDGRQVTQFKNSKANTSKRVKNGKWTPK